ncbi:Type VI secretion system protein ImpA [Burkholderiales bacterium 8X]|nr:Type VI secretion system protein ImpA [Burkholderiales bacterium 8X]
MLTPEAVDSLLSPVSEASPCGEDLEYDAAFMAVMAAAEGKPEQQFGDTVIPAVEPEWRRIADEAAQLLSRAKDVRIAMLLLRAATRQQGIRGFAMGFDLLVDLLDRFWAGIHPTLDADDDNDPTMRLNTLAPLWDESLVLQDLLEASLGNVPGIGPVKLRDVVMATQPQAGVGTTSYTAAQIEGALDIVHRNTPDVLQDMLGIDRRLARLQALITERCERADAIDLHGLRSIAAILLKAARNLQGSTAAAGDTEDDALQEGGNAGGLLDAGSSTAPRSGGAPGEIRSRQDALQTLDRVIRYLEQAEPGNPAPLLIARAKKLIGVSFLEIMADLAPNALDTIETVTGKQAVE